MGPASEPGSRGPSVAGARLRGMRRERRGDPDTVCRPLMATVRPFFFLQNHIGFIIRIGGWLHHQGFGFYFENNGQPLKSSQHRGTRFDFM